MKLGASEPLIFSKQQLLGVCVTDTSTTLEYSSDDPRARWHLLTQAERDAAYDNNAAVSNSATLISARNEASAKPRAICTAALDVPYGTRERMKLDLYPGKSSEAPCLVFVHGGYWQRNSREAFAMLAEGMAAHGWSVAIPGYSLAPEVALTEIVREILLSLDWLGDHGASFGIAGPVVLSGWSAGAHLTALALAHPVVTAGLAVSGIYDLAPLRETSLNVALKLTKEEIVTLSPLRLPIVKKPLAIAYGSSELPALVYDSKHFHAARMAAGAPGELIAIEGADHFTILDELRRPGGALVKLARELVA